MAEFLVELLPVTDFFSLSLGQYFLEEKFYDPMIFCLEKTKNQHQKLQTWIMKYIINFNVPDNGENLLTQLIDEANVSLLLCVLIFADGRSVLVGKNYFWMHRPNLYCLNELR
jgi:hypothetical protein